MMKSYVSETSLFAEQTMTPSHIRKKSIFFSKMLFYFIYLFSFS